VTISGSGLKDVKAVRFGQKDATPTAGPKQNQLTVTAPTLQDAGNIADVDLTLIYAVDKPTNSFVIGKYRYDDAAAAGPQPPVGGAAKPPGPHRRTAVLPNRLAPHRSLRKSARERLAHDLCGVLGVCRRHNQRVVDRQDWDVAALTPLHRA
jgi:hypothetical protein